MWYWCKKKDITWMGGAIVNVATREVAERHATMVDACM
jgi:hypothetical protein